MAIRKTAAPIPKAIFTESGTIPGAASFETPNFVINQGKLVINNQVLEASVMVDVNTGAFHHIDTIQCQLHLDSEAEDPEKTKQAKLLIAILCKMYCLPYYYTIKF